jgi:ribonuclease R
VGETFHGVVVHLTAYGASVRLTDYEVNGLLRVENLGADHWQYDEGHQCLIGRHTRACLRLAQSMRVRIAEIHPAAGQLDLVPAQTLKTQSRRDPPTRGGTSGRRRKRRRSPRKSPAASTRKSGTP